MLSREKAISGIMVVILLIIISVALTFSFLIFAQVTQETVGGQAEETVERGIESRQSSISLVGTELDTVTIKNTGRASLDASGFEVFLDGRRVESTPARGSLEPGETLDITLSNFVPGVRNVRVTGPAETTAEGRHPVALPGTESMWDFEDGDLEPDDSVGDNDAVMNGTTQLLYSFNRGKGATVDDGTNRKNDGIMNGDVSWVRGVSGNGLRLNASKDEYVAIENMNYAEAGGIDKLTVCAWVKTSDRSSDLIASFDSQSYWEADLHEFVTTDSSGITEKLEVSNDYDDGSWHHICHWFRAGDSPNKKIFIDGELVASATQHGGNSLGTGDTRFGFVGASSSAGSFDGTSSPELIGSVDELEIHHRALTPEEVEERYDSSRARFSEHIRGVKNTAVKMAGDGGVEIGSDILSPTESFSWAMWVRPDKVADDNHEDRVLDLRGDVSLGVAIGATDLITGLTGGVHDDIEIFTGADLDLLENWETLGKADEGEWHYIVLTHNETSDNVTAYLNGRENITEVDVNLVSEDLHNNWIGHEGNSTTNHLRGAVDSVELYNRVLTKEEVSSLYNRTIAPR